MRVKTVGSGMIRLLNDFCLANQLKSPSSGTLQNNVTISFEKWLQMLGNVYIQYGKDGLGLEMARMIKPSHIGISSYLAQSCETFSEYLEYANRYNRLWYNFMSREIKIIDNELVVSWSKPSYLNVGLYIEETAISEELQVAILFQRAYQLTGSKHIFNRIELTLKRPSNFEIYEKYFDCPIRFECEKTTLVLPEAILNFKLKKPDETLIKILTPQAEDALNKIPKEYAFIEEVNNAIIVSIHNSTPQIDFVANLLNLNTRNFQIKLKECGVTFKFLLNNVRYKLAKKYLSDTNLSLNDVAFLLSYKELTSFHRAFKDWSNLSPSEWRKYQLE